MELIQNEREKILKKFYIILEICYYVIVNICVGFEEYMLW